MIEIYYKLNELLCGGNVPDVVASKVVQLYCDEEERFDRENGGNIS